MYKKAVFSAHFEGNLSNGLKKGLRLDVAYGAADLGDNNICIGLFSYAVNEFLYLDVYKRQDYIAEKGWL